MKKCNYQADVEVVYSIEMEVFAYRSRVDLEDIAQGAGDNLLYIRPCWLHSSQVALETSPVSCSIQVKELILLLASSFSTSTRPIE